MHADGLLAERHSASGLQSMVVNQLVDLLPSGESRAAAVAQRLNMSTRSFTRQLAEEGTTFGEILEQLRRSLEGPPGDSLPPEATGAGMEVTKCLKPPDSGHELVTARVCRPS